MVTPCLGIVKGVDYQVSFLQMAEASCQLSVIVLPGHLVKTNHCYVRNDILACESGVELGYPDIPG